MAQYRGRPLISYALAAADAAPVGEVIIVLGADGKAVSKVIDAFPGSHPRRIVHAPDWEGGMSNSFRAAVAALEINCLGAFIFLGDMPDVPIGVLEPLADAIRSGARAAAPVYNRQRGHPVLIARSLLARSEVLRGDEGARSLLKDAVLIPTNDAGTLRDIDFRADIN